ncbi:hypothetical protein [Flavobacterium sp.]|uniref:hypothetical protein n=1 Tax=Flavobacterium sp. TaxID=239 RepID=UPI002620048C|nr:hypothetical protein [Flavobacterium sp.]
MNLLQSLKDTFSNHLADAKSAVSVESIDNICEEVVLLKKSVNRLNDQFILYCEALCRIKEKVTALDIPGKSTKAIYSDIAKIFFGKDISWLYRQFSMADLVLKNPELIDITTPKVLNSLSHMNKAKAKSVVRGLINSKSSLSNSDSPTTALNVVPTTNQLPGSDELTIEGNDLVKEVVPGKIDEYQSRIKSLEEQLEKQKLALDRMTLEMTKQRSDFSASIVGEMSKSLPNQKVQVRNSISSITEDIRQIRLKFQGFSKKSSQGKSSADPHIKELLTELSSLIDTLNSVARV